MATTRKRISNKWFGQQLAAYLERNAVGKCARTLALLMWMKAQAARRKLEVQKRPGASALVPPGWMFASQEDLCAASGWSENVVRAALRELIDACVLRIYWAPDPSLRRARWATEYQLLIGVQLELPFTTYTERPDDPEPEPRTSTEDAPANDTVADLIDCPEWDQDAAQLVFGNVVTVAIPADPIVRPAPAVALEPGFYGPPTPTPSERAAMRMAALRLDHPQSSRTKGCGIRSAKQTLDPTHTSESQLALPFVERTVTKRIRVLFAARELAIAPPRREAQPPQYSRARPAVAPPSARSEGDGAEPEKVLRQGGATPPDRWASWSSLECQCDRCIDAFETAKDERAPFVVPDDCLRATEPDRTTSRFPSDGPVTLSAALCPETRSALRGSSKCGPR